ncbi:MAG: hypothetical protein ACH350_10330, partial [Parachlamydiaceae bacterium]
NRLTMKKTLFLFLILFFFETFAYCSFPYAHAWSSENEWRMGSIRALIGKYEEAGRSRFLDQLPPYRANGNGNTMKE